MEIYSHEFEAVPNDVLNINDVAAAVHIWWLSSAWPSPTKM